MTETFVPIIGYERLYKIGNLGTIHSYHKMEMRIMKQQKDTRNYMSVALWKNGVNRQHRIHRLVATAFIPNPKNKVDVNHIDGDRANNNLNNLEWVTRSENMIHSYRTLGKNVGEAHHWTKLTKPQVIRIKVLLGLGKKQRDIAKEFNTSPQNINDIKMGKSWKHT